MNNQSIIFLLSVTSKVLESSVSFTHIQLFEFGLVHLGVHELLLVVEAGNQSVLGVVVVFVRYQIFSVKFLLDIRHVPVSLQLFIVLQLLIQHLFIQHLPLSTLFHLLLRKDLRLTSRIIEICSIYLPQLFL